MTDKAYIVVNDQQEREVLDKLESQDIIWKYSLSPKTTQFIPSHYHNIVTFPYLLKVIGSTVRYGRLDELDEHEIVYDGRKEEQMSEKYIVSQDFMDKLEDWKEILRLDNVLFIGRKALSNLPNLLDKWWRDGSVSVHESNNRLIAIIRWVNGEDVFEVEKPKKWVVRSKETDEDGDYHYVNLDNFKNLKSVSTIYGLDFATKFDTKEEAQEWANSHQEVVETNE